MRWLILFAVSLTPASYGATATATQTLSVNTGAIGKLAVVPSNVSLVHTGAIFENFAGAVTVQYQVRTTVSTGSSFITVQAASDFSPANGPSIAGSDLTYACSGATVGTACSGIKVVSASSQTSVVTVGSGVCTGDGCGGASPNSVTVNLNLVDSPAFKSGSYSTSLTFSISAL